MIWQKKYNTDALFLFPMVDRGTLDFVSGPTIAAGDAKLFSDAQSSTNIAVESVAFTSGSEEPTLGDTIDGATSGESGTFMFAVVTSGTYGGGDAAGFIFMKAVSGAFQAENLDINGGTANVMTIGADFTAGLFVSLGNGGYALALTAAEMSCGQGYIHIVDSATKEWEDQALLFETFGNASAAKAVNFDDVMRGTDSAATAANLATVDGVVDTILVDTADMQPKLGTPAADIAADVAAVKVDTAATLVDTAVIGAAGAGLTDLGGMSTGMKGEVNAEADTAISDASLATAANLATVDTVVDSILVDTAEIGSAGAGLTALATAANLATVDGVVDAVLVDTGTTIPALLPAALVSGRMSSDAVSISGSTAAADNLEASAEVIVIGAAEAGTLSTTQMTSDLAEATDDHYNGRIVIWTSGVLLGQASDITDYSGATGLLTYTAVTEAPSAADTFVIV